MNEQVFRIIGAALGATGILAAAFGSHGLEKVAVSGGVRWWAIGAALQLATAPVLLWASERVANGKVTPIAPLLVALGVAIFSGSLYAMALGAPRWLGAVTPLGGLLLAAGWCALAYTPR